MTAPTDDYEDDRPEPGVDYAAIHGTTLDPVYLEYLEWVEELRDELRPGSGLS